MEREAQLMRNRKGAYIVPERASLIAGRIELHIAVRACGRKRRKYREDSGIARFDRRIFIPKIYANSLDVPRFIVQRRSDLRAWALSSK